MAIKVDSPVVQQQQLQKLKDKPGQKKLYSDGLGNIQDNMKARGSAKALSTNTSSLLPDDQPLKLTSAQVQEFSKRAGVKLRDMNEDEDGKPFPEGMLTIQSLQTSAGDVQALDEAYSNLGQVGVMENDLAKRDASNATVMRAEQRVRDLEKVMNDSASQAKNEQFADAAAQKFAGLMQGRSVTGVKTDIDASAAGADRMLQMMAISAMVGGSASITDGEVNVARLFKKAHDFSTLQKEAAAAMNNVSVNPGAFTAAVSSMKNRAAAPAAGAAGKAVGNIDIKSE